MARELASAHLSSMTRGPYARDFAVQESMTPAWFASDSARRLADVILTFEAPNGGWSKHVDFSQHARRPGESYFTESADWEWISTIDNGATTEEIRFLARVEQRQARSTVRARDSARDRLSARVAVPERVLSADLSAPGQLSRRRDVQRRRDDQRAARPARRWRRQVSLCVGRAADEGDGGRVARRRVHSRRAGSRRRRRSRPGASSTIRSRSSQRVRGATSSRRCRRRKARRSSIFS